jgi:hypothetical protein
MKFSAKILPLILLVSLSACAEQENWQPTVDVANDPNASKLNADMYACRQLASKAADQTNTVAEDTGIGLVGGAAGGALLGAIAGGPATGAALGAVVGTGAGLGTGASHADATFRKVFSNCLSKRGHPVLN